MVAAIPATWGLLTVIRGGASLGLAAVRTCVVGGVLADVRTDERSDVIRVRVVDSW